jgi:hypothetical protein
MTTTTKFNYNVIEMLEEEAPEDFGFEVIDHHPMPGEILMLHWRDKTDAFKVRVHHADPSQLKVFVRKIENTADVVEVAGTTPEESTASKRLQDVGLLVAGARDRLEREVGKQGLAVAVMVRTYDGTSIHVALGSDLLPESPVGTRDLIEALHTTMSEFLAKCPSLVHCPPGYLS